MREYFKSKNWLASFLVFVGCLVCRMVPFRAPNVEPILASQMPMARNFGKITPFLFGVLSVLFYDFLTHTMGLWSFFTASAYGILGIAAFYFFKQNKTSRKNYVIFAFWGTLFFDFSTGLTVGPIFFGQSLLNAFWGQISFTLWHLAGNIAFALVLSPAIDKFFNTKMSFLFNINNNYSFQK